MGGGFTVQKGKKGLSFFLKAYIIYIPLCPPPGLHAARTEPLAAQHILLPGIPFAVLLLLYDELRKLCIRLFPGGWVDRLTSY